MRNLMTIALYKLTGVEIGEIKKEQYAERHTFDRLPEYCIKPDGTIEFTKYWLQFIETGEEEYYLFNELYTDNPLAYELQESGGLTELKKDEFNFNFLKEFSAGDSKQLAFSMPKPTHIVFDINYTGSGEDSECNFNIMGYLDAHMELKSIE